MTLLDRYIMRRFLVNFGILFLLMYLLATSIDFILQLDEYMQIVEIRAGSGAGFFARMFVLAVLVVDYYGPRLFQLFAYLLGLTTIGAMAFTLSQMYRHKELVAILASGVSMHRVAWPIVVVAFALNLLHLINSNLILPQVAPMLIRSHGDLKRGGPEAFAVPLTRDGRGALLHAVAFHRDGETLEAPTFIVLNDEGQAVRRVSAESATWDETRGAWRLVNGVVYDRQPATEPQSREVLSTGPIEFFETDLSPRALIVRRYAEFAQMLSPAQIAELLATPGAVDAAALARIKFGRYSVVVTNVLMLFLTLPFFLLREPTGLLRQSVLCASVALGATLGAFVGMELPLPGIPPVAGVFLPAIVLIPLTLFAASFIRT